MLEGDLDRISEAFGDDQRGPRALALDDGVGGKRGAVDDEAKLAGLDTRLLHHLIHTRQHAFLGRPRRGQHLHAGELALPVEAEIGESAADVDRQTSFAHVRLASSYAAVCWMLPPR